MAIANADGSIVLTTKVDDSGLKQSTKSLKSEAAKLAAEYRKAGMSKSEAMKKAWQEVNKTQSETKKATKSTKEYGEQASESGKTAQSAFKKVAGGIKIMLVALAAKAIGAIKDFSVASSELAITAEASVKRLIDIYGSASSAVGGFIDANANALGMSKAAAASYASVYGNLFSVWADQATNAELTNRYLNMTAVVASKTGRTVGDVQERIRSGLLGNTEAIEDLGIFVNVKTIEMTDAFQRMANGKSWEQLDAYTQQQIRSMAILEQATAKYGDQVADTMALTKSRFNAAWEDFQAAWGQVVNRVLMPVLKMLTDILVMSTSVMRSIFGISEATISESDAIEGAVDNQRELTNETKKTEKAAKKLFASFDDINVLGEGAEGESSQNNQLFSLEDTFNSSEISEKEKEINSFAESIKKAFEPVTAAVENLWNKLKPDVEVLAQDWERLKLEVFSPFSEYILNEFIPSSIDSTTEGLLSIKTLINELKEPVWEFYSDVISPIYSKLGEFIDKIIDKTTESFSYVSEKIVEYKDEIDMVISGISEIIRIAWVVAEPILSAIVDTVGNVLTTTIDFVFSAISVIGNAFEFLKNIIQAVRSFFEGNWEEAIEYLDAATINFVNVVIGMANMIIAVVNNLLTLVFDGIKGLVNAGAGFFEEAASVIGWDISFEANDFVPQIPSIPRLAQGAVIPPNREFLAVLGDQKQGTNIEAPLQTIVDAFNMALSQNGGYSGGNTEVVLEIDGREFGRAVVEQGNRENRRVGTRLVVV
jgi:hypothetical protein